MRLSAFRVLSFGCYGTLIDSGSGVYAALRPLLSAGGIKLARGEVLAAFSGHEALQQAETPGMLYTDVLLAVHARLAREWGVLASDDDHALFAKSVPQWPPFADTPAALQYLKRYFRLVALTNADGASFAASARRLEIRFDEVLTAEDVGTYKPDSRNFNYLLERAAGLGCDRRHILHTAESPVRDLIPAARCGLATARIDRARETPADSASVAAPVKCEFHFSSLVDMVRAHQEELRA